MLRINLRAVRKVGLSRRKKRPGLRRAASKLRYLSRRLATAVDERLWPRPVNEAISRTSCASLFFPRRDSVPTIVARDEQCREALHKSTSARRTRAKVLGHPRSALLLRAGDPRSSAGLIAEIPTRRPNQCWAYK